DKWLIRCAVYISIMTRTLVFILALNTIFQICPVGSVLKLLPDQRFITSGSVVEFRSIKIKKDIFWLNKCGDGGKCNDDQSTTDVLAIKDKTTRTRGVTKWRIFNQNSSHVIRSGDIVILENMFVRVFNSKPSYLGKCLDPSLILIECDNDSDFIKWRLVSVSHRQGMGIYESTMLRMVHIKTNGTLVLHLKQNIPCGNMKQKGVIVTSDKDPENYMDTWGIHLTTDSKFEYKVRSGYCEGGDLKTVDPGLEECQQLCDELESCVGFMFTRYERIVNGVMLAPKCWLKNESCQSVVAREYTHMYDKTQKEVTTEQYTTETTTYIADTTIVTTQTTDMETHAASTVTSQRPQTTTIMTSPVVQSTEQSTQQLTEQSKKEPIEQSTAKQSTEVSTEEPIKQSTEVSTEESIIKQSTEQTSVSYISTDATINSTEYRIQSYILENTVNKSDIMSTTSEISYNITQASLNTSANSTELNSTHTEATPLIIFLKTHTTTLPWPGPADRLKSEPETSWSESDKRISAVAVGMTAMLIIVIFLGFVFLLDLPTYVKHFKMMRRNMKSLYESMNAVANKDKPTLNT
ncbi:unnamed protein product, partial [Owenia fusiformis]